MNKAVAEIIGISAALVLAAIVLLFIVRGGMAAGRISQSANDKTLQTQTTIAEDLCQSYDRKTTSGAQIIDFIEKAEDCKIRIKVQTGTTLNEDGETIPAYEYFIYADDALSGVSDDTPADMLSRARRNIQGSKIYTGSVDRNAETGSVIGVTFSF